MEYASPVWHGSITEEEAIAMERVEASVARCVSKSPWSTPKETLFESLDWPSLLWRRDVASMVLFHKLLTSAPTSYFSECITSFSSSNSVRGTRSFYNFFSITPTRQDTLTRYFTDLQFDFFGTLCLAISRQSKTEKPLR